MGVFSRIPESIGFPIIVYGGGALLLIALVGSIALAAWWLL